MAQRLVRKLDDASKQPYDPSGAELKMIQDVLATLPENVPAPKLEEFKFFKPGKSEDNPYGFRGQIAVREQFLMSGPILELLQKGNTTTSTDQIEEAAIKSGMMTMKQNAILRVCSGQTTLEEVLRVLG
jgi:type II secretory ATPase GspE/PulE/Tfp pilus assembly ATPase PilB-like protein